MDKLWENGAEDAYQSYLRKTARLSDRYISAIVIFGMIEIITSLASFFLVSGVVSYIAFVLIGLLFILLFYLYVYRGEREYRGITASLWYFIKNGPITIFVSIFAVFYYFAITLLLISSLAGYISSTAFLIGLIIAVPVIIMANPLIRVARTSKTPIENTAIVDKLRSTSVSEGMKFIEPRIFPGVPLRFANAFCSGMIRHKVLISDYLMEKLSEEETLAVLLHEYGHARYHHMLRVTIPLAAILAVVSLISFYAQLNPHYFYLQSLVPLLILLEYPVFFYKRWLEMKADQFAAKFVGAKSVAITLEKVTRLNLTPPNRGSYTHPSLNSRQRRLHKLQLKGKIPA